MATGGAQLQQSSGHASTNEAVEFEHFIDQQLAKATAHVRVADIAAGVLVVLATAISLMLILAVIDHWLFDLGLWGRMIGLSLLITATAIVSLRYLLPPLWFRVNPAYAARMIEQGEPSLKNSLVNLLFLRARRETLHQAVYRAVEMRAATDLSHVDVESIVDRSHLIRCGAVAAAICAVFLGYAMVSPKDPFQTVRRIFVPFADIQRPARVAITDVMPGDCEIYQGRFLELSAVIDRADDDLLVEVIYSTEDGQVVDRRVPMTRAPGGTRFEATLPPEPAGMRQHLRYRIAAADAVTREYHARVSAAPSIVVQRVDYQFPRYTQNEPKQTAGEGSIEALEGTRVTIHAEANLPIKSAYVEFHAGDIDDSKKSPDTLAAQFQDRDVTATFTLAMRPDRLGPLYDSYQLRFVTEDGYRNERPIRYGITVIRDLEPTVDILTPTAREVHVPVDGTARIEIRAADPDFALSAVYVRGVLGGKERFRQNLISQPTSGQVVVNYSFVPQQLGLRPGDSLLCQAI
ncbi:MAG: hypothetical protein KDA99_14730, partial [Planctomycetales bacterium]|nr:hypothetical protein [Planctomycetales bacterium]